MKGAEGDNATTNLKNPNSETRVNEIKRMLDGESFLVLAIGASRRYGTGPIGRAFQPGVLLVAQWYLEAQDPLAEAIMNS